MYERLFTIIDVFCLTLANESSKPRNQFEIAEACEAHEKYHMERNILFLFYNEALLIWLLL